MRCEGFNLQDELDDIPVEDVLTEVGIISRYSLTKDGNGGRNATWVTVATPVACDVLQPKPTQPTRTGERLRDDAMSTRVRVARGVWLNQKDHILISGTVYDIQGEVERQSMSLFHDYWCQIVTDPNEATP